jgi:hypothetical protein
MSLPSGYNQAAAVAAAQAREQHRKEVEEKNLQEAKALEELVKKELEEAKQLEEKAKNDSKRAKKLEKKTEGGAKAEGGAKKNITSKRKKKKV